MTEVKKTLKDIENEISAINSDIQNIFTTLADSKIAEQLEEIRDNLEYKEDDNQEILRGMSNLGRELGKIVKRQEDYENLIKENIKVQKELLVHIKELGVILCETKL